ncbi:hypothetical protein BLNAU_24083 [Blattamonas nauphoetae]|uniref:Uncharacterized protein n=1 Tax=Blattamonas nauphoetae TaxID=2049346 RepID=A0ABQ9WNF6_9EUKA|nr:hypothetical protein BLNAU_24083 [Blattamonas nauphoetae]
MTGNEQDHARVRPDSGDMLMNTSCSSAQRNDGKAMWRRMSGKDANQKILSRWRGGAGRVCCPAEDTKSDRHTTSLDAEVRVREEEVKMDESGKERDKIQANDLESEGSQQIGRKKMRGMAILFCARHVCRRAIGISKPVGTTHNHALSSPLQIEAMFLASRQPADEAAEESMTVTGEQRKASVSVEMNILLWLRVGSVEALPTRLHQT